MKVFNLGVYELKDKRNRFTFVEHIFDTIMKRAPVGFSRVLGIQYIIGTVFAFSLILKPKCLVYSVFSFIFSLHLLLAFH